MNGADSGSRWLRGVLFAAAAYNIARGFRVVLMPAHAFQLLGSAPPNHPELRQCIGMIIGEYGIGSAIAAFDPMRHWPTVPVGLPGRIIGPIGFLDSALRGRVPRAFGLINVTNDLIR